MGEDYYAAMHRIEQRRMVGSWAEGDAVDVPMTGDEREPRVSLAAQLAEPDLKFETHLDLVKETREVLNHNAPPGEKQPMENENGRRLRAPPGYPLGASPDFL
jgi:hypothetical protein